MRALAVFRTPHGEEHELGHGDLIGRLGRARLRIDDPRVSEAHAMVSLRGGTWRLLALRGRLKVEGKAVNEIELEVGLEVELAPELKLVVEDLVLPDEVLGLTGEGLPLVPLQGVMSFWAQPRPRLEPGFSPDAELVVWGEEDTWRARLRGGAPFSLEAGARVMVGGYQLGAASIPLAQASSAQTLGPSVPLRLVASYDTVQVHQGGTVAVVAGVPARLLSELIAFKGPAAWEVLAAEIWGATVERDQLRTRFDMALSRLRKRLRDAGIRSDLVIATGTGQIELVLRADDVVEDCM